MNRDNIDFVESLVNSTRVNRLLETRSKSQWSGISMTQKDTEYYLFLIL